MADKTPTGVTVKNYTVDEGMETNPDALAAKFFAENGSTVGAHYVVTTAGQINKGADEDVDVGTKGIVVAVVNSGKRTEHQEAALAALLADIAARAPAEPVVEPVVETPPSKPTAPVVEPRVTNGQPAVPKES